MRSINLSGKLIPYPLPKRVFLEADTDEYFNFRIPPLRDGTEILLHVNGKNKGGIYLDNVGVGHIDDVLAGQKRLFVHHLGKEGKSSHARAIPFDTDEQRDALAAEYNAEDQVVYELIGS